jgi:hypothetical protein
MSQSEAQIAALHYDHHQFDRGRSSNRPVSSDSRISHEDYSGMHTEAGFIPRSGKWIPKWSLNDSKLQHVISNRLYRYAIQCALLRHVVLVIPEHLKNDFPALQRMANQRFAKSLRSPRKKRMPLVQHEIHQRHLDAVRAAGGYAQLETAIAYRSFRLGWKSKDIAESLGVTPEKVRQSILRLRIAARLLGFEKNEPRHWTAGTKLRRKRKITIRLRRQYAGMRAAA